MDGVVVEEPQFRVGEAQKIELDPQAKAEPQAPMTLMFHQPPGMVPAEALRLISPSSHAADDPEPRRVLKSHFARLTDPLPLQPGAGGLAVWTQDWRVTRKRTDVERPVEQEYVVEVSGAIAPGGLGRLQHGLSFEGRPLPAIKVSWQNENRLRFALKAPRPGQIAAMCEQVGLSVVSMKRLRVGRLSMAKLAQGHWRYLSAEERF